MALVPGVAEEIIEVNEFPAPVLHAVIRLEAQLAAEQLVRRFARHAGAPIIVVAETGVHRHFESIGESLGLVDAGLVLEVEVDVG